MKKRQYKIIVLVVLLGVAVFAMYEFGVNMTSEDVLLSEKKEIATSVPIPGEFNSEHSHISLLVFVGDTFMNNMWQDEYMVKDPLAHFEGEAGIVHKHATGVTVPYFLNTLGFSLTDKCITIDDSGEKCEDGKNKLNFIVNGENIERPEFYEMQHGDRIMVDFSSDDESILKLKFNNVLPVPDVLMKADKSDEAE